MAELEVALTARVKAEFSVQRLEAQLEEERASAKALASEHACAIAALKQCRDNADVCMGEVGHFLKSMKKKLVKERRKLSGERNLPWECERPRRQGPCEEDKRLQLLNKVKAWDKFVECQERLDGVRNHAAVALEQASKASPHSTARHEIRALRAQLSTCQEALEKTTCALQLATISAEKAHVDQAELHKLDLERFRDVLRRRQEASEEENVAYKAELNEQMAAVNTQMDELRAETGCQVRKCKDHFNEELRRKETEFRLQERMFDSVRINEKANLESRHDSTLSKERSIREEGARLAKSEAEEASRERELTQQTKHKSELESLYQMHVEQQVRLSADCAAELKRKAGFHRREISDGIAHALAKRDALARSELLEKENRHIQELVDQEAQAQAALADASDSAAAVLQALKHEHADELAAQDDATTAWSEKARLKRASEVREVEKAHVVRIAALAAKLEQAEAVQNDLEQKHGRKLEEVEISLRDDCAGRLERTVENIKTAHEAEVAQAAHEQLRLLEERALYAEAAALRVANVHERAISELLAKEQSESKKMRLDFEKREMVMQKDMEVTLKTQLLEMETKRLQGWADEREEVKSEQDKSDAVDKEKLEQKLQRAVTELATQAQTHHRDLLAGTQAAERVRADNDARVRELERDIQAAGAQSEAQSTQSQQTVALETELRRCVDRLVGFQEESERERASRQGSEVLQQRVAELEAALVCMRAESQLTLAELSGQHQTDLAAATEDYHARMAQCAQTADATLERRIREANLRSGVERREVEAQWREKLLGAQAQNDVRARELVESHVEGAAQAQAAHDASHESLQQRLEANASTQRAALERAHAESTALAAERCAQQAEMAQGSLRQAQNNFKAELADVEARCRQTLTEKELRFEQSKLELESAQAADVEQLRAEALRREADMREDNEALAMEREKERCYSEALDAADMRNAFDARLAEARREAGLAVQQREADHEVVVREISRAHARELELAEKQARVAVQQLEAHFASELNDKETASQRRFDELRHEFVEQLLPLTRVTSAPTQLSVDCNPVLEGGGAEAKGASDTHKDPGSKEVDLEEKYDGAFFEVDEHDGWTERVDRASGNSVWVHKSSGQSRLSSPRGLASPQQRLLHDQTPKTRQRRQTLEHLSQIHVLKQTIGNLKEKHEDEVSAQLENKLFSQVKKEEQEQGQEQGQHKHHDHDQAEGVAAAPMLATRKLSLDEQYRLQRGKERQFAFDFSL